MKEQIFEMLLGINPYMDILESTQLIDEGVLDSMSILLLISEIEDKFNITIPLEVIKIEDFQNIESIVAFVKNMMTDK